MKDSKFTIPGRNCTARFMRDDDCRAVQFGNRLAIRLSVAWLLLVAAAPGFPSPEPAKSRSFNGITATFEIKNPVVKIGEDLKIVVIYRNKSSRTVNFNYSHLDGEAEVYEKGKAKPIVGGFVGELPYMKVTLKPGDSFRFEDVFSMQGWPNLSPGAYEIRFCYHLGLLNDESRAKEYQARYPHDGHVVPWSDRRYAFTLVK